MKIALDPQALSALKAFLRDFEDSEALSEREYVVDLYDADPPMSLDLILDEEGARVDGAAALRFDPEMDGWYVGERIERLEPILSALRAAGALKK